MSIKGLSDAKQQRDRFLLEFKAAYCDLEDEIKPSGERTVNVRRVKQKLRLVKASYDDCLQAQAHVFGLEKISGAEESNWTWVDTNLRKPRNKILEEAEDVLESLSAGEDPDAESKAQMIELRRDAKLELSCFQVTLKDKIQGVKEAYESTSTWLKDNHEALTGEIEKLDNDLNKQYMVMCKNYLKFLEGTEVDGEVTKQEKFRS